MSMADEAEILKGGTLAQQFDRLQELVRQAGRGDRPMHEIEGDLWRQLLRLGHQCLAEILRLLGLGDLGEAVTLPTGETVHRLDEPHRRRYVSVFGEFILSRFVYGSREKQAVEFVPLDSRLQLPAGDFSYLLQDWDQALCVEQAFGQASATVRRMLGLGQSVDALEHMNRDMARGVTDFMLTRPQPEEEGPIVVASADQKGPEEEGPIVVASADQKGVVLRRPADDPPPKAHRSKGDKASQKRMATVATVYTVDPHRRTPEEVVAALFRDAPQPDRGRPEPRGKEAWACLPRDDEPGSGTECAFAWLVGELYLRGRAKDKPLVFLADGQESLWDARRDWLPERAVDVLDLLHVTPRLWKAAHVFHPEGSRAAEDFVRGRLLRVLRGQAAGVVRGLREMGTKRGLGGGKKKALAGVCSYLEANLGRMRYDEYLAAGYPIASGAVEGACRHLVKDRMERAGMHWTVPGAQAMLDVRSIYVSGLWEAYQEERIELEGKKLYPHRHWLLRQPAYDMSA